MGCQLGQGLDRKVLEEVTLSPPHTHFFLRPVQLLDFLDVLDDPVLGYLPPTVITVLHTHLFSCAVDYRYRRGLGEAGSQASLTGKKPAPAQVCPSGPSTSLCVSWSLLRPSPSPATLSWTRPPSYSGMQAAPRPGPSHSQLTSCCLSSQDPMFSCP